MGDQAEYHLTHHHRRHHKVSVCQYVGDRPQENMSRKYTYTCYDTLMVTKAILGVIQDTYLCSY